MGLAAPQHVGSFWIRDQTASPSLAGGFSTTEPPGKPPTALFALCKAAKSETISSSIIIKEPKWGGSLHTAEGVAAGLCLPLDAHYWVPSVSSGPQPPAGSTLPLWATGLLQEESALMLFSLRSPIIRALDIWAGRFCQGECVPHLSTHHLLHQRWGFLWNHSFLALAPDTKKAAADRHQDDGQRRGMWTHFSDLLHISAKVSLPSQRESLNHFAYLLTVHRKPYSGRKQGVLISVPEKEW